MELKDYRTSAHATWYCKYHVVFCPKYRHRILRGRLAVQVRDMIRQLCQWKGVDIEEGHVSSDHIHLCLVVPPKLALANLVGTVKGKTAIRLFQKVPKLRKRYWGQHFWARGYFGLS